jgi:hypothetical protein
VPHFLPYGSTWDTVDKANTTSTEGHYIYDDMSLNDKGVMKSREQGMKDLHAYMEVLFTKFQANNDAYQQYCHLNEQKQYARENGKEWQQKKTCTKDGNAIAKWIKGEHNMSTCKWTPIQYKTKNSVPEVKNFCAGLSPLVQESYVQELLTAYTSVSLIIRFLDMFSKSHGLDTVIDSKTIKVDETAEKCGLAAWKGFSEGIKNPAQQRALYNSWFITDNAMYMSGLPGLFQKWCAFKPELFQPNGAFTLENFKLAEDMLNVVYAKNNLETKVDYLMPSQEHPNWVNSKVQDKWGNFIVHPADWANPKKSQSQIAYYGDENLEDFLYEAGDFKTFQITMDGLLAKQLPLLQKLCPKDNECKDATVQLQGTATTGNGFHTIEYAANSRG